MTKADKLQHKHLVAKALSERLERIKNDTADWHDYHQAGALLSELAQSVWIIQPENQQRYEDFLIRAIGYMEHALGLAPDALTSCAIGCDLTLAKARLARLPAYKRLAEPTLKGLRELHEELTRLLPKNVTAQHQAAIACTVQAQLCFGRALGFPWERNNVGLGQAMQNAEKHFKAERATTPDGERAWRSYCLTIALCYGGTRRRDAKWAFTSALRHRDWGHMVRATVIYLRGNDGERWLRTRRDSRVIQQLVLH